jgi:hypothetical protein
MGGEGEAFKVGEQPEFFIESVFVKGRHIY